MTDNHVWAGPTKADEGWSSWIEWSGGECPLPEGAMHEVQYRSGERAKDDLPQSSYWQHDEDDCDIVAYRYRLDDNTMTPESDMHPDLEWLARNVSEWGFKDHKYIQRSGKTDKGTQTTTYSNKRFLNSFTKAQWLQARKDLGLIMSDEEMEMDVPEWAGSVPEGVIKRGKTEAETLALNGWKVGDILEGDEGNGPDRILITAIGEDVFTCKWDYKCTGEYHRESGNTTLSCRNWRKVGHRAGINEIIGGNRTAENFLHEAANLMAERGKQYDHPGGERSMSKAVAALNAITGRDITESEGWLLMSLVKRVRQHSGSGYHKDSAEDAVAYAALEAEALESVR